MFLFFTGTLARERLNLTQQVVELKKMKEIADTDIARKDSEIVGLSQQHQQALQDARHQRHQNSLLQSQVILVKNRSKKNKL